ncbi:MULTISPECIES: hypothetical protein [unclassified Lysobacter]|uniref:hypothetical protein n=1 Tax=unclassified Lysobacter TaxID=2635362 RepID=UPI0006F38FE2|nr:MULTISPECIES: hypothetical protein [unclassified Lysobacter]KRA21146.1 hypothetical protein ASD69_07670 [Lysobacter sp. Root604]KRD30597.1 hypothetical protein ASE35_18000 [Lysobacter sp. Root916]KRD80178.1 hypothetical protein ASE43_04705 [Lysobacter sp. Root983]
MGHALLAFVKWFFAAAIVGVIAGGVIGGMMGTDVDSSYRAGQIVGVLVWPIVLVVAIAGTCFSVSREKKRHAQALAGPRISDQYRNDRDNGA